MDNPKLHLVLKHIWFDMIASGQKREEYRSITPYWTVRILPFVGLDTEPIIVFHRGYTNVIAEVELKGVYTGSSRPEWSENGIPTTGFVLELGKVIKTENWTYREVSFDHNEARAAFCERISLKIGKWLKEGKTDFRSNPIKV